MTNFEKFQLRLLKNVTKSFRDSINKEFDNIDKMIDDALALAESNSSQYFKDITDMLKSIPGLKIDTNNNQII